MSTIDRSSEGGMLEEATAIRDNPAAHRFELDVGGDVAIAVYRLDGKVMAVTHTEVPPALEGKGIGGRLVRGVLDEARRRGLMVLPLCSFVARYMSRHPETQDLLPPAQRSLKNEPRHG